MSCIFLQSGPPGSDTAGSQAVNVTRRESVGMDMTSCYSSQTGAQFMQPSSSMDTATFLQQYFEKRFVFDTFYNTILLSDLRAISYTAK